VSHDPETAHGLLYLAWHSAPSSGVRTELGAKTRGLPFATSAEAINKHTTSPEFTAEVAGVHQP
jgi:hypothetical protein